LTDKQISGVAFLDKPAGWTSRRAVNEVSRIFGRIRAGHAGTLDPLATGMLPILLGEATRFSAVGLDANKTYEVTMDLGCQTDTLDAEGKILARFDTPVSRDSLENVLLCFTGKTEQVPPAYSAIHVNGRRAYELARQGDNVSFAARTIVIHELRLLEYAFSAVTLRVCCSKGTYIRSLARDIGSSLGAGGCVTALRRISTGSWPEAMMLPADKIARQREACILPLRKWLGHLPQMELEKKEARRFAQGQRIQVGTESQGAVAVFSRDILLGTGNIKPGMYRMVLHPVRILPSAQRSLLS